jgi:translocation protein SEC66
VAALPACREGDGGRAAGCRDGGRPPFSAGVTSPGTDNLQANGLVPGWGQIIFQSANEIAANKALRDRLDEIEAQTEHDKAWWEKRRASIKTEFMKELDDEAAKQPQQAKAAAAASEDEAVLVETESPLATPAGTPSGASKKKKGKK